MAEGCFVATCVFDLFDRGVLGACGSDLRFLGTRGDEERSAGF